MCFGGGGGNAGKQQAKHAQHDANQAEAQRQSLISAGKTNIDKAFSSFDPGYYDNYVNAYEGNYFPALDQQFGKAKGSLTAGLGERGIDESTVGAGAQGDLQQAYTDKKTEIANNAQTAAQQLKQQVAGAKQNLYALNTTSADPSGMNAQAIAQATALTGQPATTPLGDVFAAGLQPWLSYAKNKGGAVTASYASPYAAQPSGAGSAKVIG